MLKAPLKAPTSKPTKYPANWAGPTGKDSTAVQNLPVIPEVAKSNPEYLLILKFHSMYKSHTDYWLIARLINTWLYGHAGSLKTHKVPLAQNEPIAKHEDGLSEVNQLVFPKNIFENQSAIFKQAYKAAKNRAEALGKNFNLKDLYLKAPRENTDRIKNVYRDAQKELKSKPESRVVKLIGNFNFKHNPTLYLGSETVQNIDYLNPLKSGDLFTYSALARFPINIYGLFEMQLWNEKKDDEKIEMMEIVVKELGVRLSDNFDFKDGELKFGDFKITFDQPLGVWANPSQVSGKILESNEIGDIIRWFTFDKFDESGQHKQTIGLRNSDFRKFRDEFMPEFNSLNSSNQLVCEDYYLVTPIEKITPKEPFRLKISEPEKVLKEHNIL